MVYFRVQVALYFIVIAWLCLESPAQLALSGSHLLYPNDGKLYSYGQNGHGQAGVSERDFVKRSRVPIAFPAVQAAAGSGFSIVVDGHGVIWAFGNNRLAQLGLGREIGEISVPTKISSLRAADISGSFLHCTAVSEEGSLWAWGSNLDGQISDTEIKLYFVPICVDDSTDWASTSSGTDHNLAIKKDGSLWGWGGNRFGQAAPDISAERVPLTELGRAMDWAFATSGSYYSLALDKSGALYGWGRNEHGQLGLGHTKMSDGVQEIDKGPWRKVATGVRHSAGIKMDGTLWAWGRNKYGQLGTGDKTDYWLPTPIGCETNWVEVQCSTHTTVAMKNNGSLWIAGEDLLPWLPEWLPWLTSDEKVFTTFTRLD